MQFRAAYVWFLSPVIGTPQLHYISCLELVFENVMKLFASKIVSELIL